MKKTLLVILLFLSMLPEYGGVCCHAAGKNWDRILDKYESLCESCLRLKLKAEAGERVSKSSLSGLFSSLSELRAELRSGQGSMTERQRSRFESIRTKYSLLFGVGETQADAAVPEQMAQKQDAAAVQPQVAAPGSDSHSFTDAKPRRPQRNTESRAEGEPIQDSVQAVERQHIPELPLLRAPLSCASALSESSAVFPVAVLASEHPVSPGEILSDTSRRLSGSLSAVLSVLPERSCGASVAIFLKDSRWGIYLKAVSNFRRSSYSYTCSSDGSYGGGKVWTTGVSSVSCLRASAGVRRKLGRRTGLAAGAGYGSKTLLWEDVGNSWAKVNDLSVRGLLLECGPVLNAGPFDLQLTFSTVNFRSPALEIGIGYRF